MNVCHLLRRKKKLKNFAQVLLVMSSGILKCDGNIA